MQHYDIGMALIRRSMYISHTCKPVSGSNATSIASGSPRQHSTAHRTRLCSNSASSMLNRHSSGSLFHKASDPQHAASSLPKPAVALNRSRLANTAAAASDSSSDIPAHDEHSSGSSASAGSTAKRGSIRQLLQQWNQDIKKMRGQLQSLGLAGVVAYGLFNTAYYTVTFLFIWFTVANVPAGLGLQGAARKAAEVFALVWAGSQVR